ncbi:MAG: hypothetical protein KDD10_26455 [Phaeodactylibacter sp.]|nr:hypothetical protein [Phaeodactylibacter sp.]MCB9293491.1 hypothetical protein [Lewinellaceae bacterium]
MQKFITLLFALAVFSTAARSQNDDSAAIQKRLDEYFRATEAKDWNKVVDMVYPKLFGLMEKKDMVQLFADMEGNGMVFQMKDFEVRKISETVTYEGERFAIVDYSAGLNIRFTSEAYQDSSMVNILKSSFETSYGAGRVSYNPADNSFDIQAEKTMYAIAPEGSEEWAFMESDPAQASLTGTLIPKVVREELGVVEGNEGMKE